MSEQDPPASPEAAPERAAPRRRRRGFVWGLTVLLLVLVALTGAALSLAGRSLAAPDWLRDEISTRVNAQLGAVNVSFEEMHVIFELDNKPRLLIRNIDLRTPEGAPLAQLADLEGSLALRPLLRGQVQPGMIRLSGATLDIRRSAEGALDVAIGDAPHAGEAASGFTDLIGQIDAIFTQPELARLHEITADNLIIRYEDARTGQAWTIDSGRLRLTRVGDALQMRGDFALLGNRGFATTLALSYLSNIGEKKAELGLTLSDMPARDIAQQSPALAWLDVLDAPLSGALRVTMEEDGALGPLHAALQIGAGVLQPSAATAPIPFSRAHAYFTYAPETQSMQFDEVFLDSKWVTARAEGKAFLVGLEQGLPRELWTQIQVTELSTNPAGLYQTPLVFEAATVDARLELDPFAVTVGQFSLSDQGQRLVVDGTVEARPEGWALALDGRMDGLAPERLVALWPETVKDKTRNWIRDNVIAAALSDIQLALRAQPEQRPSLHLGFDFEGLETRFMRQMPRIEAARGHGSLYDGRFVIAADRGFVTPPEGGRVEVGGTSFIVPNVAIKQAPARVYLQTHSSITAALSLLDHAPFGFLSNAGQPVTLAQGHADVSGQLDFLLKPQLQTDEVAFDVTASARGVRNETLVEGRVLSAPELTVTARNGLLEIGGAGQIGAVPAQGVWRTDIGKGADGASRLQGQVELSPRFVDEFGIGLPPGSVSGATQGQIEIDFPKGAPGVFRLSSDLAGLGLRLKALDWSLGRDTRGTLEVAGRLGAPPEITSFSLNAPGLSTEGSISLRADGQLERARFSRVRAGGWIDAPVDLVGRGPGAPPQVEVRGGMIDLRQTSLAGNGDESGSGDGGSVSLTLDRLQISDGIALTGFRADLDMARGANGRFSATVNDGAAITGAVVPQNGRSAFRIQADDAGDVLRSAGLLKTAREGALDLTLLPATERGSYNGRLTVSEMRLKDAPALAALLNALSIVGILDQLNGDGIHFSAVEAEFQLTPDRVILTQGSAVGASMGISMDGFYFLDSKQMDMQGVFSPLYLVNAVGGLFTRRGEGLIGFNYSLSGSAQDPQVQVNPLSLLTPGMFREIFRRPAPQVQR